jgi:hypothetical protein
MVVIQEEQVHLVTGNFLIQKTQIMQNKFVISGKYRIKSKSTGCTIEKSSMLRVAKENGQEFLYFTGIDENGLVFNHEFIKDDGDYFLPQDVEVYLEVGGKYTPIDKTAYGFEGLEQSENWKDAKILNQPFLYYVGAEKPRDFHIFSYREDKKFGDYFMIDDIIPYVEGAEIVEFNIENNTTNTQNQKEMERTFEVSEKFIQEAYTSACSEWKQKIKEKFPEAILEKPFNFDKSWTVTTSNQGDRPIIIGQGWAPDGKEFECLVVNDGWEMRVSEHNGRQVLEFFRK